MILSSSIQRKIYYKWCHSIRTWKERLKKIQHTVETSTDLKDRNQHYHIILLPWHKRTNSKKDSVTHTKKTWKVDPTTNYIYNQKLQCLTLQDLKRPMQSTIFTYTPVEREKKKLINFQTFVQGIMSYTEEGTLFISAPSPSQNSVKLWGSSYWYCKYQIASTAFGAVKYLESLQQLNSFHSLLYILPPPWKTTFVSLNLN